MTGSNSTRVGLLQVASRFKIQFPTDVIHIYDALSTLEAVVEIRYEKPILVQKF